MYLSTLLEYIECIYFGSRQTCKATRGRCLLFFCVFFNLHNKQRYVHMNYWFLFRQINPQPVTEMIWRSCVWSTEHLAANQKQVFSVYRKRLYTLNKQGHILCIFDKMLGFFFNDFWFIHFLKSNLIAAKRKVGWVISRPIFPQPLNDAWDIISSTHWASGSSCVFSQGGEALSQ